MSYTILYKKIVFKIPGKERTYYLPFYLAGSNNLYDVTKRSGRSYERRSRDWSILCNQFLTKAGLEEYLHRNFDSDEDLGCKKKEGAWLTGKAFIKWWDAAIRKAVTIEDFLKINKFDSIRLSALCSEGNGNPEKYCRTSEDVLLWMQEVNEYQFRNMGKNIYISIDLPEEYYLPNITNGGLYHLKIARYGKLKSEYVTDINSNHSLSVTQDRTKAKAFSGRDIENIISSSHFHLIPVKVSKAGPPAVIQIVEIGYILNVTKTKISYCPNIESAKKYSSLSSAEAAVKRLNTRTWESGRKYEFKAMLL